MSGPGLAARMRSFIWAQIHEPCERDPAVGTACYDSACVTARRLLRDATPEACAALDSAGMAHKAPEGLARHHEYCDTMDPFIKGKPCNCPGKDATPEACAQLDADAEAMRVRRAVEESGQFISLRPTPRDGWEICLKDEEVRGDDFALVYRAAYDALRKAGKL